MEGNPWRWQANEWIEYEDYDISTDFPTIREWEMKMSGVENRLCFRHIRNNESVETEKNKNNRIGIERIKKVNNNDNCENDHISRNQDDNSLSQHLGKSTTTVILTHFPNTAHNILIIEKIREIRKSLNSMLVKNDQNFKTSNTYKNNKISFRFLIDQLSLPSKMFHAVLTTLLYAIVIKDDDIKSQVNDCNDGLRTVRDTSPCHSHIQNIKIDDPDYDLSQESIPKKTSQSKPIRSAD